MRVLHVSDVYLPRLGGIELHVHDLAARQRAAAVEAVVVTTSRGPGAPGGSVVRLPARAGVPTPAAHAALSRLVTAGGFDVLHAHSSLVSPLAWTAARTAARAGVPALVTMHSMWPPGPAGQALGAALRRLPPAVTWTAVSTAAAAALAPVLPVPVGVLPNGVDPAAWAPRDRGPAGGPPVLVSVMRTARRKRPLPLLRVLEAIRRQVPADQPLRAVLVGAGPLDTAIARRLARSDLGGWVTQTGRLSRPGIRAVLERADLYLAPATAESFGIAALEARCAGVPVLGRTGGGLADFLTPGVDGHLLDSDAELAATAARLLRDPAALGRLQTRARDEPPPLAWPAVLERHREAYAAAAAAAPYAPMPPEPVPPQPVPAAHAEDRSVAEVELDGEAAAA